MYINKAVLKYYQLCTEAAKGSRFAKTRFRVRLSKIKNKEEHEEILCHDDFCHSCQPIFVS